MAQARSFEIKRCAGVDETSQPAGMMVPFGDTNLVVLETSGMDMDARSNHPGIVVKEFDGSGISSQLIDLNNSLYQPDVDPLFKAAFLPTALYLYKPRYFRIHGGVPITTGG